MRGRRGRRRQSGFLTVPAALGVAAALLLAACGTASQSPRADSATRQHGSGTAHATTTSTALATPTTATPGSTLPAVSTAGPLQVGAPIAMPFSADRVTAAESPDGAVFAAPQDPMSSGTTVSWVIDGGGPAAVAEHVPQGIAALAADSVNFYVATYATVYAYNRASGNQSGQWTMPHVDTANSSNDDLVAMAAAGGVVLISVTRGNAVSVYRVDPASSAAPRRVVRGLGDVVGPDGSVYYEATDHRLSVLRPDGTTMTGPVLAHAPNGLGGGVQYLDVVAGGAVWVGEPAGQGLDTQITTYDASTLHVVGSYSGSVTSTVVDSAAGPLVLEPVGTSAGCPSSAPGSPASCVLRIDAQGTAGDPADVGAAVILLGPGPAVILSDTATGQFDLVRLS